MKTRFIQKTLNGEFFRTTFFRDNKLLLIFVAVLFFGYISIGYYALFQHNHLTDLTQQVKDARNEYITLYCQYSSYTQRSHIIEELKRRNIDLNENTKMSYLIVP